MVVLGLEARTVLARALDAHGVRYIERNTQTAHVPLREAEARFKEGIIPPKEISGPADHERPLGPPRGLPTEKDACST